MDPDDELEGFLAGVYRRWQINFYTESVFIALSIVVAYLVAVIYLGWFIFHKAREEMNFHDKYGENWREMYEKYHGSLSHAQLKIGICLFALLAVGVIIIWFYRQTASKKSSPSHPA